MFTLYHNWASCSLLFSKTALLLRRVVISREQLLRRVVISSEQLLRRVVISSEQLLRRVVISMNSC